MKGEKNWKWGSFLLLICVIVVAVVVYEKMNNKPRPALSKFQASGVYEKYSGNPIGDFTSAGQHFKTISDPSVLYIGGKYHLWLSCNNGNFSQICYATSTDGVRWTPYPEPVLRLGRPGSWDDYNSEVPTVIKDGPIYKMWYSGYSHAQPNIYINIGYATSPDGSHWTRLPAEDSPYGQEGVLFALEETKGEFYSISDPMVLKVNGTYRMWYNSYVIKPFNGGF